MKRSSGVDLEPIPGKGISRDLIMKSIMPKMTFSGPGKDDIAVCSEMPDPDWVHFEGEQFPPFEDGYRNDFYRDDDDCNALFKESQLIRLDELDQRMKRREDLAALYDEARRRFGDLKVKMDKTKRYSKFEHKYGISDDNQTDDDYFENRGDKNDSLFIEAPQKSGPKKMAPSSPPTIQDILTSQITYTDIMRVNTRTDFENHVIGLLAFDNVSLRPVLITGSKEIQEYETKDGLTSTRLISVRDLETGEFTEIKIDDISNDEFPVSMCQKIISTSFLPNKKALLKIAKQLQKDRSMQDNYDAQMDNLYKIILNSGGPMMDASMYEYRHYVHNLEARVEELRKSGDVDEELSSKLDEIKMKLKNLESKRKDKTEVTKIKPNAALSKQNAISAALRAKFNRLSDATEEKPSTELPNKSLTDILDDDDDSSDSESDVDLDGF